MKKNMIMLVMVVVGLLIGVNAFAEIDIKGDIISKCQDDWVGDYAMQKYCIDSQIEAHNMFHVKYRVPYLIPHLDSSYDDLPEEVKIIARCIDQWMDAQGRADWLWILDTCDAQIEAYNQMKLYAK